MSYENDVPDEEFDLIVRKADALGFHVQRHRQWDPNREGGPLYVQHRRKFREEHQDSLLRYATAEEVWQFLADRERELKRGR